MHRSNKLKFIKYKNLEIANYLYCIQYNLFNDHENYLKIHLLKVTFQCWKES